MNKDELIECITECIRDELNVLNEPFVERVCNNVINSVAVCFASHEAINSIEKHCDTVTTEE